MEGSDKGEDGELRQDPLLCWTRAGGRGRVDRSWDEGVDKSETFTTQSHVSHR